MPIGTRSRDQALRLRSGLVHGDALPRDGSRHLIDLYPRGRIEGRSGERTGVLVSARIERDL